VGLTVIPFIGGVSNQVEGCRSIPEDFLDPSITHAPYPCNFIGHQATLSYPMDPEDLNICVPGGNPVPPQMGRRYRPCKKGVDVPTKIRNSQGQNVG